MIITPIKTRKLIPPKDDLSEVLDESITSLEENSILAISSKIVSIGEGRCIPLEAITDKDALIKQEADLYLSRDYVPGKWLMHTVTNNLMIGTAGIDESNANGHYILWPKNPKNSAKRIYAFLTQKFGIKNLGIIITDSHSIPLRRGVVGISLAHYGFDPLLDYRGKEDLFGRELHVSQTNFADGLAAAAVVSMGEGDEQTPLVLLTDIPHITFTTKRTSYKKFSSLEVPMEEDLYKPIFTFLPWEKGGRNKK